MDAGVVQADWASSKGRHRCQRVIWAAFGAAEGDGIDALCGCVRR